MTTKTSDKIVQTVTFKCTKMQPSNQSTMKRKSSQLRKVQIQFQTRAKTIRVHWKKRRRLSKIIWLRRRRKISGSRHAFRPRKRRRSEAADLDSSANRSVSIKQWSRMWQKSIWPRWKTTSSAWGLACSKDSNLSWPRAISTRRGLTSSKASCGRWTGIWIAGLACTC